MRRIFTSVLSFSFVAMGLITTHAQKIEKTNISGDFPKKSSQELAKSNGFDRCSFVEYEEYLQKKDPKRMTTDQFEAWIAPLVEKARQERLANKSTSGGIVTIPVVVHVIHSGEAYGVGANITDEQVQSQITVMNQDFRRMVGTPGYNTNAVGADIMIQFALAKVDVNGNPTNGIDRVNLCYPNWSTGNINGYVKPLTIWDPTQYMNMWSVNFSNAGLLGYAQFPSNSGIPMPAGGAANTDGVVANYTTFGSTDFGAFPMNAPYDKGRTMTHEVGHFLGLRHIWGDTTCGTDYCADTPVHEDSNGGCPSHPKANNCGSTDEMFENYMDYTFDACMNIFTQNQKDRITAVMNNSPRRVELKTSTKDIAIPLFANDAEIKLENVCTTDNSTCTPSARTLKISLYNRGTSNLTSAVISFTVGTSTETYTYSGNLASNKYAIVNLPISAAMPSGSMTVSITTANGVADQRASNNSFTTSYVSPGPAAINNGAFTFTLQNDYWGSEVTWNLKNSAGNILYQGGPYTDVLNPTTSTPLPTPIVETFNLSAAGCYTFTINDTEGDGMYNYGGYYNLKNSSGVTVFEGSPFGVTQTRAVNLTVLGTSDTSLQKFAVYPNPATDILNITKVSGKAKFEIHNAVGQLVKAGDIKNNQVRVAELVKGTYIITVKDNDLSENIKFIKK
ncbi:M43 family zinc metalloprotease [Chryseobacterium taiwanense]|uniref:M43 family zinc metalloprotease n=1 Tax=Chryseobacterium taiwanense TaxID=363331 RepID=UPI0006918F42|nr:M43 family zinc metalloprotease [Chryseobacterium taiwanense]